MNRIKTSVKVLISLLSTTAILGALSPVQARDGRDGGDDRDHHDRDRDREHHSFDFFYTPHYVQRGHEVRSLPRGFMRIILGGIEYYCCEGQFYRPMADRYVVVQAPIGAVVSTMPEGCQPVIIDGVLYYMVNGITYMRTTAGYQVVPQPKVLVVQQPAPEVSQPLLTNVQQQASPAAQAAADNTFTVNIPNAKGGYTAVILTRSGNGFAGPQGEYYTEFPKIEQLKVMYGK